nr:MAG TPA: hypothetical protein [Caudoviricetes sp.]
MNKKLFDSVHVCMFKVVKTMGLWLIFMNCQVRNT